MSDHLHLNHINFNNVPDHRFSIYEENTKLDMLMECDLSASMSGKISNKLKVRNKTFYFSDHIENKKFLYVIKTYHKYHLKPYNNHILINCDIKDNENFLKNKKTILQYIMYQSNLLFSKNFKGKYVYKRCDNGFIIYFDNNAI